MRSAHLASTAIPDKHELEGRLALLFGHLAGVCVCWGGAVSCTEASAAVFAEAECAQYL